MASAVLNIRTDKETKEKAETIFSELGLSMSTAINVFLKTTVRENGLPFSLRLEQPNAETVAAIEEGRLIANDSSIKAYDNISELRKDLGV